MKTPSEAPATFQPAVSSLRARKDHEVEGLGLETITQVLQVWGGSSKEPGILFTEVMILLQNLLLASPPLRCMDTSLAHTHLHALVENKVLG